MGCPIVFSSHTMYDLEPAAFVNMQACLLFLFGIDISRLLKSSYWITNRSICRLLCFIALKKIAAQRTRQTRFSSTKLYGSGTKIRTVCYWVKKFKTGNIDWKDDENAENWETEEVSFFIRTTQDRNVALSVNSETLTVWLGRSALSSAHPRPYLIQLLLFTLVKILPPW